MALCFDGDNDCSLTQGLTRAGHTMTLAPLQLNSTAQFCHSFIQAYHRNSGHPATSLPQRCRAQRPTRPRSAGAPQFLHATPLSPAAMMLQCHTTLSQHSCRPVSSSSSTNRQRPAASTRQPVVVVRAGAAGAAGGFGRSNKKKVATDGGMVVPQKFKNMKGSDLSDDAAAADSKGGKQSSAGAPPGFPADWVNLKLKASDFPLGKDTKPVELVGRAVMVYKFAGRVFVSDAASTAYQYPMTDARLSKDEAGRVTAEVPLDGTIYDLSTGEVLKWCPADNPMRGLLGTLKSRADPTPLKVFPVHVTGDGSIYTKLV